MLFRKILFALALLIPYLSVWAQAEPPVKNESYFKVIRNVPRAIAVHIPAGYQVLDTAFGNLNLDNIPDLLVALKSPLEDTSTNLESPVQRPLLILLGNTNGGYTLGFRNDKVVYCILCGGVLGDPFNGLTIKNGYFTVEHYGGSNWRWTNYITFKFNPATKHFYLHRIDYSSYHTSKPDKIEKTVKTQKHFGVVDFINYDEKYNL